MNLSRVPPYLKITSAASEKNWFRKRRRPAGQALAARGEADDVGERIEVSRRVTDARRPESESTASITAGEW